MKPKCGYIEITSHCNFKCTFCPSECMKRKKSHLPLDYGKKFIEQFAQLWPGVPLQLNVLGEPLINKDMLKYFDICEQNGVQIILITNISLLDDELAEKIFQSYNNFTLVLSLQTPNEYSYKMRGYDHCTFADYYNRIEKIIELKIKNCCRGSIEIHIASTDNMLNDDSTILSDVDMNIFPIFETKEEQRTWHLTYLEYLDAIHRRLENQYYSEYHFLLQDILREQRQNIEKGIVIVDKDAVPMNMYEMTEDQLWGYMCMPGVYLRYKTFGLWTREPEYLSSLFNSKNVFTYVAERLGNMTCPMADNIGLLSNGEIISCCLDYEGDMHLGNIADFDLSDQRLEDKINQMQRNVLIHPLCRRCKGDIVVASKTRILGNKQQVQFYAGDWHPFEQGINDGQGGRWSKNSSTSYVFARLAAKHLSIHLTSPYTGEVSYFKIYFYSNKDEKFTEEYVYAIVLSGGEQTINIPFDFQYQVFYKIEVHTATVRPCDIWGVGDDSRYLGICLYEMSLQC